MGVLGAVHALPLVGPSLTGLAGVTVAGGAARSLGACRGGDIPRSRAPQELGLRVFEETITFSNARAKETLGVAFTPLATTVKDGMTSMVEGGWVKPRKA